MIGKIKVGMMLNDAEGYYKVLEIYEKSNVFCKVRVMGFDDECNPVDTDEELTLTLSEVKKCLKHQSGKNINRVDIEKTVLF